MALDGKILARAREQIGHTHANNVAEHYLRQEKIYSQIPEIHRIDDRLRAQMSELVGLTIKRSADLSDALKALEDESLALQAKRPSFCTLPIIRSIILRISTHARNARTPDLSEAKCAPASSRNTTASSQAS